ncbi:MAG TPA: DNA gyrase inhibitor YacG [Candidatus Binataceae bacterium]|nr:DNA gyrase inhibitor YacG [Candidatus Binataceae bacterium]
MRCPICKKPTELSATNRYRPFCSERCQMTDLGTWASEQYAVPGGPVDDHEHPEDREHSQAHQSIDGGERKKLLH